MLTGFQVRAARAGVNLKLKDLSDNTGIALATLKRMEKTEVFEFIQSKQSTIKKLLEFYNACGIYFEGVNGLVAKKQHPK